MAFSPDGRLLAAGAANRSVPIWDLQTGRMLHQLAGHDQPLHCLVFSPDGKVLATACKKKSKIKVHPDEASCVQLGREMHGPTLCRDLAAPCGLTARYGPRLFAPKGP
jgi:WD40 repeat protein